MNRRIALATLAGVLGVCGKALGEFKIQTASAKMLAVIAYDTKKIPCEYVPSGNGISIKATQACDSPDYDSIPKMKLFLSAISVIEVEFDGQVKTISPKELWEAL